MEPKEFLLSNLEYLNDGQIFQISKYMNSIHMDEVREMIQNGRPNLIGCLNLWTTEDDIDLISEVYADSDDKELSISAISQLCRLHKSYPALVESELSELLLGPGRELVFEVMSTLDVQITTSIKGYKEWWTSLVVLAAEGHGFYMKALMAYDDENGKALETAYILSADKEQFMVELGCAISWPASSKTVAMLAYRDEPTDDVLLSILECSKAEFEADKEMIQMVVEIAENATSEAVLVEALIACGDLGSFAHMDQFIQEFDDQTLAVKDAVIEMASCLNMKGSAICKWTMRQR